MRHIDWCKKIVNHYVSMLCRITTFALAVMGSAFTGTAQVSESGFYYIKSNVDQTFYLCPTQDPSNPTVGYWVGDNLMLTTKQNPIESHAVWRVESGTGDNEGYFQIIHQTSGKYLINDKTDKVAEAAHLGTLPDDDANTWFKINYVGSYYNILGKAVTGAYSLNPYSGNRDTYIVYQSNNTGIVGYWDATDGNSKWQLVKVTPIITETSGVFSITFPVDNATATIYYTTDGSDPTTSDTRQVYTSTFQLTDGDYKVRAVAVVGESGWLSGESTYIVHCAQPTISQSGATITMSCTTPDAKIRYTTNGSDPTAASTLYTGPITLDLYTTIATFKAVAMLHDDDLSTVAVHDIAKCDPPSINSSDADGTVTMTCPTAGVDIRYTTNGSTPTATSPLYTGPTVLLPNGNTVPQIKAIAFYLGKRRSDPVTFNVSKCAAPVISNASGIVTITSATPGATIHYAMSGDFVEYTAPFSIGGESEVRAYASHAGYSNSDIATYIRDIEVARSSDIIDMNGRYVLSDGFVIDASVGTSEAPFAGTIDGQLVAIASASVPLVAYADGATIKNVVISEANIASGTNVGAIAAQATGATRIYNCGILGGTVSGTGYVGSIVGRLDGEARVINCYSFADVSGGTSAAGIVGYNNVASTRANIKTMVMNCMYYGNVSDAESISPVYGGQMINNSGSNALNNFNYYSFADFTSTITTYNCALGAEARFLTRFEFYRQILNSNRELAAWYATGSVDNARMVMAKWVLDKTVAPYPILKPQGKYTSIVNYDPAAAASLGTLTVTISGVGENAPAGASITTSSLTLTRTDKDSAHFNFNYDKVQLPYYNDIGTKNYTGNRVVVGWKVTAITGGTSGTFKKEDSDEGYNFADRNCTQKDLYSVTGRVLSQGAYFNVPNGVTAITIEPYWANAVYLSDPNYDKTYSNGYAAYDVTNMGTRFVNKQVYSINGSSQMVYTNMGDAISALNRASGKTVYDYAVVLVGNYHHYYGDKPINNDTKGLTIMSADLDGDNEPDNCFFYQHQQRQAVTPIRFDFLCWPGIGMAQKPSDSPRMPGIGIFKPRGWFEVTNTVTAQFYEVEYDWSTKNAETGGSPLILLGGVVEQIASTNDNGAPTHTKYIHIGDNAWFKMFNNGVHQDKTHFTPHIPISVTGGDYDRFYLSGMFRPGATVNADNAECYISGGRFGEVAGAGQEQIKGNVTWKIDHADIASFYGGGINDAKPVLGNITVLIANSNVGFYCGGPKFGNMASGKAVSTTATNCTFGRFFGAGYGGTSFNRISTKNLTNAANYGFSSWVASDYKRQYNSGNSGIATNYEYELFAFAGFADDNNVGRFYVNYASLSLATAGNVTSTLTGCTITENFYGGGNLGKVVGNVASTLTSCTVRGSVYGAGFSAKAPTVDVMPVEGFSVEPHYDGNSGTYTLGVFPTAVTYTWKQAATVSASNEFEDEGDNHFILTTVDMSSLGTVQGNVEITIAGDSHIGTVENDAQTGHVFGGGEESQVIGNTKVTLSGNTKVMGSVFGGGKQGNVSGNTSVILED